MIRFALQIWLTPQIVFGIWEYVVLLRAERAR